MPEGVLQSRHTQVLDVPRIPTGTPVRSVGLAHPADVSARTGADSRPGSIADGGAVGGICGRAPAARRAGLAPNRSGHRRGAASQAACGCATASGLLSVGRDRTASATVDVPMGVLQIRLAQMLDAPSLSMHAPVRSGGRASSGPPRGVTPATAIVPCLAQLLRPAFSSALVPFVSLVVVVGVVAHEGMLCGAYVAKLTLVPARASRPAARGYRQARRCPSARLSASARWFSSARLCWTSRARPCPGAGSMIGIVFGRRLHREPHQPRGRRWHSLVRRQPRRPRHAASRATPASASPPAWCQSSSPRSSSTASATLAAGHGPLESSPEGASLRGDAPAAEFALAAGPTARMPWLHVAPDGTRALARRRARPPVEDTQVLDSDECLETFEETWAAVVKACADFGACREAVYLMPSTATPGTQSGRMTDPNAVAEYALGALKRVVPPAVPGIFFLQGGQSETQVTEKLNAIDQGSNPWHVTFSYARAHQNTALKIPADSDDDIRAAQSNLSQRAGGQLRGAEGRMRCCHGRRGRHRCRGHVRQGVPTAAPAAPPSAAPTRAPSAAPTAAWAPSSHGSEAARAGTSARRLGPRPDGGQPPSGTDGRRRGPTAADLFSRAPPSTFGCGVVAAPAAFSFAVPCARDLGTH